MHVFKFKGVKELLSAPAAHDDSGRMEYDDALVDRSTADMEVPGIAKH